MRVAVPIDSVCFVFEDAVSSSRSVFSGSRWLRLWAQLFIQM